MATKTYNFKTPLLNADDQPIIENGLDVILSDVFSTVIMESSIQDNSMKFFDWALELKKSGVLIVDETDKEMLTYFINHSQALTVLGKGRLINVFRQVK